MTKNKNYAEVNTSYTTFFLFSCIGLGLFFGNLLPEPKSLSAIVIILYVLLLYFIWDFIKQLYSPGQAVFLYAAIFLVMPFAMNWLLVFPYAHLGSIVLIGSYFIAGILELLYEKVSKISFSKNILARTILIDNKIDRSLIKISSEQIYITEYRGLIFAVSLATIYFVITYVLFGR